LLIRDTIADEDLPQIGAILNAAYMREVFARELMAAGGALATCRIDDLEIVSAKYRPSKNFLVCYLLKIVGAEGCREQLMTMLACRKGESIGLFASAIDKPLADTGSLAGVFQLPELEAVVWAFPNERKLTGLPVLLDTEALRGRYLPELFSDGISEMESEPVHYVPERSCTVRVNVSLRAERTGDVGSRVLFGKTYCLAEGEAAWHALKMLWESEARIKGRLSLSQPLAYQAEIKTLWQCGLEGKTLHQFDVRNRHFYELLAKAGSAVAELHRTQVTSVPLLTKTEIVSKLAASENLLSRLSLKRRGELRSLTEKLMALSDGIGKGPIATLHGDLHLKNLFVTEDRIVLIDLDNLSRGDPLRDLGSFIASLHYRRLVEGWGEETSGLEISGRFIEAYRANVDWEVSEPALNWYIASALIYERAYRCVTRLKVERLEILDELIELANTIVAGY
jgi:thiamine kinase-like enzyme